MVFDEEVVVVVGCNDDGFVLVQVDGSWSAVVEDYEVQADNASGAGIGAAADNTVYLVVVDGCK